jgi:hypothetical protein
LKKEVYLAHSVGGRYSKQHGLALALALVSLAASLHGRWHHGRACARERDHIQGKKMELGGAVLALL